MLSPIVWPAEPAWVRVVKSARRGLRVTTRPRALCFSISVQASTIIPSSASRRVGRRRSGLAAGLMTLRRAAVSNYGGGRQRAITGFGLLIGFLALISIGAFACGTYYNMASVFNPKIISIWLPRSRLQLTTPRESVPIPKSVCVKP